MAEDKTPSFKIERTSLGMNKYVWLSLIAVFAVYIFYDTRNTTPIVIKLKDQADDQTDLIPIIERCAQCHGQRGELSVDGSPFLAGQNADYLTFTMRTYTSGLRKHPEMVKALLPLKIKQFKELALYYSGQEIDWQGKSVGIAENDNAETLGIGTGIPPIATGEALAQSCVSCHDTKTAQVPHLNSLEFDYLVQTSLAFQAGARPHIEGHAKLMQYNLLDIERVSLYLASLPASPIDSSQNTAKPTAADSCKRCHGETGNSRQKGIPSLASQDRDYLIYAMTRYRDGHRLMPDSKAMKPALEHLDNAQVTQLADYYASQAHQPRRLRLPRTPAQLALSCDGCHGYNGNSFSASRPKLAGQAEGYILKALRDYKTGRRNNKAMRDMLAPLTTLEIREMAHYYSSQRHFY